MASTIAESAERRMTMTTRITAVGDARWEDSSVEAPSISATTFGSTTGLPTPPRFDPCHVVVLIRIWRVPARTLRAEDVSVTGSAVPGDRRPVPLLYFRFNGLLPAVDDHIQARDGGNGRDEA